MNRPPVSRTRLLRTGLQTTWLHTIRGSLLAPVALFLGQDGLAGMPLTDPRRLLAWWETSGPIVGAFSVVRLAVLVASLYWAALGLAVTVIRWSRLGADAIGGLSRVLPGVGWVARGLASGSIAGAVVLAGAGQAAAGPDGTPPTTMPPTPQASVAAGPTAPDLVPAELVPPRLVPLGPQRHRSSPATVSPDPTTAPTTATPTAAPSGASRPTATQSAPSESVEQPTTPPTPSAVDVPTGGAGSQPGAWMVRPGDNLWSISEAVLHARLGRQHSDAETARYWRRLIAVNRSGLPSPGDPDLIFAGEPIILPSL